ncbi:putative NBD/HSP70 family sugar kinase [Kribbella voronezhensis]|uniref:Putative NBD/HSP70 family sugar kinase n=1 Tax=Kribbella voronezhensis TaxID=2512212 RepID=A0A4R7TAR6_9ACTN|nr:ROK family transcriptional regulator [Kribbella voronezhensis]TDU89101.1 putative NBD/HSP70 family sugar kinase [Kribbella voronezhensis]
MANGVWRPLSGPSHQVALEILLDGPLSRAELSRRVGLSPGSLTRITKPMVESGLLVEVSAGPTDPRVGRPSQPLDIIPESHHFAGIKLTADAAVGVLTTLRAEVIASAERPLTDHAPESVAAVIADLASSLASELPGSGALTGIGVTLGGRVAGRADVRWAPFLDWNDVSLGQLLAAHTDVPVVVANDVLALTEATHWFGAGRGVTRFCLLTIGAGIGYGLVVHDKVVDNADASLGLVGHIPLLPDGPLCDRGHRGCAMVLLSSSAITGQVSTALGRPVGYDDCLELAANGDPVAAKVVGTAGQALGRLIALAANFTLPERVILGGEGIRLATLAEAEMLEGLHAGRDPLAVDPPLVQLPPDFTEWARGAAVTAIQTFVLGQD